VTAVAQLLLDPFYRTIRGFCILIDKSWLQYGHKFGERLGLNFEENACGGSNVTGTGGGKEGERAPIFFQFMDAVWQVLQQFPMAFEFVEEMLITIMDHAFSGRFGTFLMNSEREREAARLSEISPSLWTYVLEHSDDYLNPFYSPRKEPIVLYPRVDPMHLSLWKRYYLRYFVDRKTLAEHRNKYVLVGKEWRERLLAFESELEKLRKEKLELERTVRRMTEQEKLQLDEIHRLELAYHQLRESREVADLDEEKTSSTSSDPHHDHLEMNLGVPNGKESTFKEDEWVNIIRSETPNSTGNPLKTEPNNKIRTESRAGIAQSSIVDNYVDH